MTLQEAIERSKKEQEIMINHFFGVPDAVMQEMSEHHKIGIESMLKLQKIMDVVDSATHLNYQGSYDMDIDEAFEVIEHIIAEQQSETDTATGGHSKAVLPKIKEFTYEHDRVCGICEAEISRDWICCPYCGHSIDWSEYDEQK